MRTTNLMIIGLALAGAALILGQSVGCYTESAGRWEPGQAAPAPTAPQASRAPQASQPGQVYYLDGAGGGGMTGGWGRGVRKGLEEAGLKGGFTNYPWHTQLGVMTDQRASVKFKRDKAAQLARSIRQSLEANPDAPLNLIGLSAGTAVAVFALEALPENVAVDNVVLLGSSLSSQYDLTSALKRVDNRMYVFTSSRDTVLRFLVPVAGTADRKRTAGPAAGVGGFRLPLGASSETRRLYAKLVNVAWNPEFERAGNYGGHTAVAGWRFVRDYVAPLILQEGPRYMRAGARLRWASQTTAPSPKPATP